MLLLAVVAFFLDTETVILPSMNFCCFSRFKASVNKQDIKAPRLKCVHATIVFVLADVFGELNSVKPLLTLNFLVKSDHPKVQSRMEALTKLSIC